MKADEIKLGDWSRIFYGEVPSSFYMELIIRAFFFYLLLMLAMRLMGKRMSSQLTRNEMAALVSLAAAIGVPMVSASNGLLPAVIIVIVVVLAERGLSTWTYHDKNFEKISQGNFNILIEKSVLHLDEMQHTRISRERLFSQLRSEGLYHLGQVLRLYMEANGSFTIIKNEQPSPGLLVLPYSDKEFINEKVKETGSIICMNCATPKEESPAGDEKTICKNCGKSTWTKAVETK